MTDWRSMVASVPDGGTGTGAGSGVCRTPEGGTAPVTCASNMELGVWANANAVSVKRPSPSTR
jgi:hypothetical protein